ncbi:MAG: ABC transporter ATP-binding protein [Winogradskyella sp.]|nr:ABC transporter ATP-binding protein [Winogradskyella sp.]NNK41009.1 ABC transporter ATP-binding protein [Winogradskyella sp.]
MSEQESKHIVLKTKDLSIGYRSKKNDTVVQNGIDLQLPQGQLIGLVGANGIGKSTLLRTLIKVQPALKGKIYLNDTALESITSNALARQLSIVLTEPVMSKNLSVFELIALGRHPYTNWIGKLSENDIEAIDKSIDLVNIDDLRERKCFELSDGQLQKVMIARALAQDTDLIVLDEPTTHLDMYHKAYILKLLQKLTHETCKTILFSSHEIELAIQLCDSLIVMTSDGIIQDTPCNHIEQGTFTSLFPTDLILFDEKTGSFRVKK